MEPSGISCYRQRKQPKTTTSPNLGTGHPIRLPPLGPTASGVGRPRSSEVRKAWRPSTQSSPPAPGTDLARAPRPAPVAKFFRRTEGLPRFRYPPPHRRARATAAWRAESRRNTLARPTPVPSPCETPERPVKPWVGPSPRSLLYREAASGSGLLLDELVHPRRQPLAAHF